MKQKRNLYDKEFIHIAVNLCLSGPPKKKEAANELGIDSNLLNRWKGEFSKYGNNSFAGNVKPVMIDEEMQITRLKGNYEKHK